PRARLVKGHSHRARIARERSRSRMTARRALWGLVAASTLLRLALAASLGPGNDEAYYALFALHPDWSYFDQPPMLAVVEGVGMGLAGQVPRDLLAGRDVALPGGRAVGPPLAAAAGTVPGPDAGDGAVLACDRVERGPRVGLVRLPGWPGRRGARLPARHAR